MMPLFCKGFEKERNNLMQGKEDMQITTKK